MCVVSSIRWFQTVFPPAMRVRGTSTYPSGSGDQDLESTPIDTVSTQPQDSIQRTKTAKKKKKSMEKASLPENLQANLNRINHHIWFLCKHSSKYQWGVLNITQIVPKLKRPTHILFMAMLGFPRKTLFAKQDSSHVERCYSVFGPRKLPGQNPTSIQPWKVLIEWKI